MRLATLGWSRVDEGWDWCSPTLELAAVAATSSAPTYALQVEVLVLQQRAHYWLFADNLVAVQQSQRYGLSVTTVILVAGWCCVAAAPCFLRRWVVCLICCWVVCVVCCWVVCVVCLCGLLLGFLSGL